jgi:hypothetical protein
MSREKTSYVDDMIKLRRILDNASDPTIDSLRSKDETTLESVRKRLQGDREKTQPFSDRYHSTINSLEPRVFIHTTKKIIPQVTMPLPQPVPSNALPEFELVTASKPPEMIPVQKMSFQDMELFEVEKIDEIIPEFLEVVPKETLQKTFKNKLPLNKDITPAVDFAFPEWQPINEEQILQPEEPKKDKTQDNIPEFERIEAVSIQEKPQLPEVPSQESMKPSFPPTSIPLPEPTFQILTKKQQREAKKAERKKQKEAKRLRKIEQKELQKEKNDTIEPQTNADQQPVLPLQEKTPEETTSVPQTEPPNFKVDATVFEGIGIIDEKTAELLYKNGYFSIENIQEATVDDLVQIRGIKRKLARQIKKEVEQKIMQTEAFESVPPKHKITKKKLKKTFDDSSEWESHPEKKKLEKTSLHDVCTYNEYTLYKRETTKPDGKKTIIHFFSKEKPYNSSSAQLPDGYQITVNKKTGIPYLKKKR